MADARKGPLIGSLLSLVALVLHMPFGVVKPRYFPETADGWGQQRIGRNPTLVLPPLFLPEESRLGG
jgi:hypothetical protein